MENKTIYSVFATIRKSHNVDDIIDTIVTETKPTIKQVYDFANSCIQKCGFKNDIELEQEIRTEYSSNNTRYLFKHTETVGTKQHKITVEVYVMRTSIIKSLE